MTKQRRGSTDLEWISKYQHSDHHVDRQTRTKLEFPCGLPPTPFTNSPTLTKRRRYEHCTTRATTSPTTITTASDLPLLRPQRLGLPPVSRLSISPRTSNDINLPTHLNFPTHSRQRSNSFSFNYLPPLGASREMSSLRNHLTPFNRSRDSSLANIYLSTKASCSTPASRRGSVVDHVTQTLVSSRATRATSVPGHYESSRGNGARSRFSFVLPPVSSDVRTFRRNSLAPGLNGVSYNSNGNYKRTSVYSNVNSINNFNNRSYCGSFVPPNYSRAVNALRY